MILLSIVTLNSNFYYCTFVIFDRVGVYYYWTTSNRTIVQVVAMMVVVIRHRMKVMVVGWHCTWVDLRGSVFMAASRVGTTPWAAVHQLGHEADVGNGQPQRLDAGQTLFVGECGNFAAQLIESLVQVEHPTAFSDIRRSSLGDWGDSASGLLRRCGVSTAGRASVCPRWTTTALADQGHLTARP